MWSTPSPGRFILGKDPVPIVEAAWWAPGPVGTGVILHSKFIIIIIIIIPVITLMQCIYNYIPETNHVSRVHSYSCSVFTVCATCNVISPVKYVLYFYISPSGRTMALGSTQLLTEMSTRCIPWG